VRKPARDRRLVTIALLLPFLIVLHVHIVVVAIVVVMVAVAVHDRISPLLRA